MERRGPAMKREHVYRALQLALLLVAAWIMWRRLQPEFAKVTPGDFARWRPALWPLALSTVGLTLMHLAQCFLWRRVVVDVGSPRPAARTTVRVYFISGLARFIPGSLWQYAGLAALGQQAGISPLAAAAAGAIGNIAFLATGVVFLVFTLPGQPGAVEAFIGVVAAALALAGVFVFTGTASGARVRRWVAARAPAKLRPALELAGQIRPAHAIAWTAGYAACWVLLDASFIVFVTAFVPGAAVHWRELAGTMAASYLIGFITVFAPGGIGVREGAMLVFLAPLISLPAAVVVSVAQRVWFFVAEFLALGSFPLFPGQQGNGADGGRDQNVDRTLTEVL